MIRSNIVLIGMPGAGKSTIGVLLAKALGRRFLDTDVVLQAAHGKSLPELIDQVGLAGFCRIEADYIKKLNRTQTVIATGGSVVYHDAAMEALKAKGVMVYLRLPLEVLQKRVVDITGRGIVIESGQTFKSLFEKRVPLYEKYADVTVDLAGCTHEQAVEKILNALSSLS